LNNQFQLGVLSASLSSCQQFSQILPAFFDSLPLNQRQFLLITLFGMNLGLIRFN